jgi:hypothetical protein
MTGGLIEQSHGAPSHPRMSLNAGLSSVIG